MNIKEKIKEDILKAIEEERYQTYIILNYLINKNSKSLLDGGFNHEQFLEDIEELEDYLTD